MDAKLKTLLCEKSTVVKSKKKKKMETGSNLGEFSTEGDVSKDAVLPMIMIHNLSYRRMEQIESPGFDDDEDNDDDDDDDDNDVSAMVYKYYLKCRSL
jgi:hypothetical protein